MFSAGGRDAWKVTWLPAELLKSLMCDLPQQPSLLSREAADCCLAHISGCVSLLISMLCFFSPCVLLTLGPDLLFIQSLRQGTGSSVGHPHILHPPSLLKCFFSLWATWQVQIVFSLLRAVHISIWIITEARHYILLTSGRNYREDVPASGRI